MASSQVVRVDALRSLGFASISVTYAPVGAPFTHPMRLIKFTNTTDADLLISFDDVNDNMVVPKGSFTLFDCTTNKTLPDSTFVFANGTQVWVKGSPTLGTFYIEVVFGQGD